MNESQPKTQSDRVMARVATFVFCGLLLLGTVFFLALPDKTFSEEENRALQTLPRLSSRSGTLAEQLSSGKLFDNLFSGKFAGDFATYCADQFPARNFFIGCKATAETALLKGKNNGVLNGADGYLISEPTPVGEALTENIHALSSFASQCGVPVTVAVAGRTVDVMQSALPALYDTAAAEEAWRVLDTALSATAMERCDLLTPLRDAAAAGGQVAYRTDHHWTTYGAYLAYCALMEQFGMTPSPLSDFTVETASDAFYGTTDAKAGYPWKVADTLQYYRFAGDEDYTTTVANTDISFSGFYDRSYLEQRDKYSSFLSGNYALITVTKNTGEKRPTLLLLKDSYAHSLAPFLAQHFDLVLIDLRYYRLSVSDYLAEHSIDRVLVLYNMDTLLTGETLKRLKG